MHLVPDDTEPDPVDGSGLTERVEAFVVRTALDAEGEPMRSRIVHVRSRAEASSTGWQPDELVSFMEDCLRLPRSARTPVTIAGLPTDRPDRSEVDLDVGVVIGGRGPDVVDLAVATTGRSPFTYGAVLAARPYPGGATADHTWTTLATLCGAAAEGERLDLRFADVTVPAGLHRLRLRVVAAWTGDAPAPEFALVGGVGPA